MTKYKKYKSSDIEWIGEIPEHWEVKKTKYCFIYTTGFTPPTGESKYFNDDHIWVTISDINQKFISESYTKLSLEAIQRFKPSLTSKGSLLFSFKLSIGKVAFATTDLYTNEAILSIKPGHNFNLNLFYYSLSNQLLMNANENIYGAKLLNQELIRNAVIIFPPLPEQTQIANYLDHKTAQIDDLITKKQQLIKLLEEEKTAVINEAVTKGINPNVKLKDSGIEWLGKIPAHWEVKRLKYKTHINSNKLSENTDENFQMKYIDIGSVTYGELKEEAEDLLFKNAPSRARRIINDGDTLISTVRTYLKAILFIRSAESNLIASTGFAVITPQENFHPNYLFYILSSEAILQKITANSVGVSYPAINPTVIGMFNIWFPEKEEQIELVNHIEKETTRIDKTIATTKKMIELLKEYRTALISEAVTGKIKVFEDKEL